MQQVSYVHTLSYTTDCAEDLARCVLEQRGDFRHGLTKAFFVGSGSEANDAAMKCARQYWFQKGELKRRHFVARRQGYHGSTIGAMSVSSVLGRKVPDEGILMDNATFVGPADEYHGRGKEEMEEQSVEGLVEEVEREFLRVRPEAVRSFM